MLSVIYKDLNLSINEFKEEINVLTDLLSREKNYNYMIEYTGFSDELVVIQGKNNNNNQLGCFNMKITGFFDNQERQVIEDTKYDKRVVLNSYELNQESDIVKEFKTLILEKYNLDLDDAKSLNDFDYNRLCYDSIKMAQIFKKTSNLYYFFHEHYSKTYIVNHFDNISI